MADWVVSGAGDDNYNGDYNVAGTYHGKPYYIKVAPIRYLYFWGWNNEWALDVVVDVWPAAYFSSPGDLPASPWMCDSGAPPAPDINPVDLEYYGDVRTTKTGTDNLGAKITIGFAQKYFIIEDDKESEPSNFFWIVIKRGKESEAPDHNNITVDYLNDLGAKIFVYNPTPTGDVVIG